MAPLTSTRAQHRSMECELSLFSGTLLTPSGQFSYRHHFWIRKDVKKSQAHLVKPNMGKFKILQ